MEGKKKEILMAFFDILGTSKLLNEYVAQK